MKHNPENVLQDTMEQIADLGLKCSWSKGQYFLPHLHDEFSATIFYRDSSRIRQQWICNDVNELLYHVQNFLAAEASEPRESICGVCARAFPDWVKV